MSKYEILDPESTEYFDILVETGFAKRLDAAQMVQILQTITDIFAGKLARQLCQGISFLLLTDFVVVILSQPLK